MKKDRLILFSILLLAALLRWIHLDALPIGRHAWRQSDTASMARNFYEGGHRLIYPQIDWSVPGYAETEFPIFPWTVSQVYRFTGESMVVARLLATCGSLLSILFLYLLARRILGRRAAFGAALLLALTPASLYFGRAIMPEAWMLAAITAGIYWFYRWIRDGSYRWLLLAAVATSMAALLKLTALHMGLPLLWLAWRKYGRRTLLQWQIWVFGLLVLLPVALWYRHAYQLGQTYGASFHIFTSAGADKWGDWQLLFDFDFYWRVFVEILAGRILTWIGLVVLVAALFIKRRTEDERLFDVWLLAVVILILLVNRGSYVHEYYSLPIVLPAVALMGKLLDQAWDERRAVAIGAIIGIAALSGYRYARYLGVEQAYGPTGEPNHPDVMTAEILSQATSPDERVISCNRANPVWLYLANRKGWGRECKHLTKREILDLSERGARLLIAKKSDPAFGRESQIGSYLTTFFEVESRDSHTLTVGLGEPAAFEAIGWTSAFSPDFSDPLVLEDWKFDQTAWRVADGYLNGSSPLRPSRAVASPAFAGCQICRIQATLSLASPPELDAGHFRRKRRQRRAQERQESLSPRGALRAWWSQPGTLVGVELDVDEQRIRFHQEQGGRALQAASIPLSIEPGRDYRIELRFDGFDFELLIDGNSLLIERSRFAGLPKGTVALSVRSAELRVAGLRVLEPAVLVESAPSRPD